MILIISPGGVGVEETIRWEQAKPHKNINHKLVGVYAAYASSLCFSLQFLHFCISFHLRKTISISLH